MKYSIGYDIGITSVGWAVKNNESNELIDFGVRKFEEASKAEEARNVRSARRTNRRRKWRLEQLRRAFKEFDLIDLTNLTKEEFDEFKLFSPKEAGVETIYHLRNKGLTEQLSLRELYQALHNIIKTRGHFYMQHIDFTVSSIKEEDFIESASTLIQENVDILDYDLMIEKLQEIYQGTSKNPTLKSLSSICIDEGDARIVVEIIKLLRGAKGNVNLITKFDGENRKTINDLKKSDDELDETIEKFIMLYDTLELSKVLSEYEYLCQKHVSEMEKYNLALRNNDEVQLKEYKKKYKDIVNSKNNKDKIAIVKNIENNYPNGLYIKEVVAILEAQQKYNQKITDEFINVIKMITSAIIPYWMGPLNNNENTKNNWMVRTNSNPVKYSYEYSKNSFDEAQSQKEWKELLIGNCTYLMEEKVLPKQSFIIKLFSILNEINVLTAEKNSETYNLTMEDKSKIINELFLKQEKVNFDQVEKLINLSYFGFDSTRKSKRRKFNNSFAEYLKIAKAVPELEIKDILTDLDSYQKNNESKINKIEDIILNISLFEDQEGLKNTLIQDYTEDQVNKLIKINCKDFASLSGKFLSKTPLNEEGMSMIDILFDDNSKFAVKNEQQTIIQNATDENGNRINFTANKYFKLLSKHNKLDYQLLVSEGKPLFPVSRAVLRSLNETMKVHNEIVDQLGENPEKVVIETARDLGDPKKEEPAKHYDTMQKLFDDILKQTNAKVVGNVSDFDELKDYLQKNKRKVELYLRQNGQDMITGEIINLSDLAKYQIDHILPRGFGDDSMDNLMLISGTVNNSKQNRTAIEYIRQQRPELEGSYLKRVQKLREMRLISVEKQKRLLLKDSSEAIGFIQRNLVDTRYIIKEFTSILEAYYKYNNQKVNIVSLQGTYNGIFRRALEFRKSRVLGEQHHAEDAGIILIVDECLNTLYPGYNKGNEFNQVNYKNFIKQIDFTSDLSEKKKQTSKAIITIRHMYEKAFGSSYKEDKFIRELKSRTPLLSWREKRKYQGQFFEQTILKQDKVKTNAPLSILNVNSKTAGYNGVEFHCIDIYKLTNKKGKKIHYAIHIPKLMINQEGIINQEHYLNLIANYYGYTDLINENGKLIEGAFRIRLYKDQFMFNTEANELVRLSGGTMANKLIEYKLTNIYNYNYVSKYKNELIEKLKNDKLNPLDFQKKNFGISEKNILTITEYLLDNIDENHTMYKEKVSEIEQLISMSTVDKVSKSDVKTFGQILNILNGIYKDLKNVDKQFGEIIDQIIYLIFASNTNYIVPTIIGQLSKSISSGLVNEDTQYCKVITTSLGVRVVDSNANKLKLEGFRNGKGRTSYRVIKKEKFTWQV